MKFVKMHGLGNDFIVFDFACPKMQDSFENGKTKEQMEKRRWIQCLCDRHCGIGADGIICISPSRYADFRMKLYNADGSQAQMCGNGIRCLGKYVYEHGKTDHTNLMIETDAGVRQLRLYIETDRIGTVRVDMGTPDFVPEHIPVRFFDTDKEKNVRFFKTAGEGRRISLNGQNYPFTAVSMGNPHGVIFMENEEQLQQFPLAEYGTALEHHPAFPEGVNVELAWVQSPEKIRVRVWERGCGETKACGTGACAVAAAAMQRKKSKASVAMELPGGILRVDYQRQSGHLFLTGDAEEVFCGEVQIPGLDY